MPNCKSCGAQIRWTKTKAGRAMPLDHPPQKMVIVTGDNIGEIVDAYTPHFATCPNAADHRKPR